MQNSEGGSDTTTSVATLRTSSSAQAPVVQPVPASQQVVPYLYPATTVTMGQTKGGCDLTVPFHMLTMFKLSTVLVSIKKKHRHYLI